MLHVGRVITGLGVGMSSLIVPVRFIVTAVKW